MSGFLGSIVSLVSNVVCTAIVVVPAVLLVGIYTKPKYESHASSFQAYLRMKNSAAASWVAPVYTHTVRDLGVVILVTSQLGQSQKILSVGTCNGWFHEQCN